MNVFTYIRRVGSPFIFILEFKSFIVKRLVTTSHTPAELILTFYFSFYARVSSYSSSNYKIENGKFSWGWGKNLYLSSL